jgi:hypothetical protein
MNDGHYAFVTVYKYKPCSSKVILCPRMVYEGWGGALPERKRKARKLALTQFYPGWLVVSKS